MLFRSDGGQITDRQHIEGAHAGLDLGAVERFGVFLQFAQLGDRVLECHFRRLGDGRLAGCPRRFCEKCLGELAGLAVMLNVREHCAEVVDALLFKRFKGGGEFFQCGFRALIDSRGRQWRNQ